MSSITSGNATFREATPHQLWQIMQMLENIHYSNLALLAKWVNGTWAPEYQGKEHATPIDYYIWWLRMYGR